MSNYTPPAGNQTNFPFVSPPTYTPPPGNAVPFAWNTSTEFSPIMYEGSEFINGLSTPGATFQVTLYEGSEMDTALNPWQFQFYEGTEMDWGIDTHPASPIDPNPIVLWTGEFATFNVIRFTYIPFVLQTGLPQWAWGTSDLVTHPVFYMSAVFGAGVCEMDWSFSTTMDLTGDGALVLSDGSENDILGLTTFPSSPLIPIGQATYIYDGTEFDSNMVYHTGFQVVLQSGLPQWAWGTSDLVTCPGCNAMMSTFSVGEEMDVDIQNNETFPFVLYEGSEMDWNITIHPAWTGANPTFYEGSEMDWSFSTKMDLTADGPAVHYDGSEMDWQFTLNPPWEPTFVFYEGTENDILGLATKIRLTLVMYDGTECDSTLTPDPFWSPSFVFYDGATAILPTIAAQQSLPPLIGYEGSQMTVTTIGNLANWYFYEGSQMLSNLATKVDLTADGPLVNYDGAWMFPSLVVKPAQPIANQWPFYEGSSSVASLTIKPAAQFQVVFRGAVSDIQVDFSNQTHAIDLARQCAVNQPDSYFYWQDPTTYWNSLTNDGVQAIPGALATGFNTYMNLTIAFKERFNPAPMSSGESMGIVNFWPLLASTGSIGFGMAVLDLKYDIDSPLCYGNFIPDGNAVDAELSQIDDTSCSVDQAYDGTEMTFTLQAMDRFYGTFYEGTYVSSILTTTPGWGVVFWAGDNMFVASNVEFSPVMYTGEFMTIAFKESSATFYDGSTFTVGSLNTNYTVEFMEVGCLQNEYVPTDQVTNPFGPPPTANIELRPYYHQIQAECF